MKKYSKLFNNHSGYNTYISGDRVLPNVSYCENENEVHYNPWTYAETYFTTVARENGTISFNIWKSMGTDMITSISYSMDNGESWTTTANQDNKSANLVIDVNVNTGDKVLWKGIATQTGCLYEVFGEPLGSFFSSDCEFDAKGNVMSLLYGDNFKGQTTIEEDYAFCFLFYDYDGEKTCGIVNAKDMSLPATTLTDYCYEMMFCGCTSLTTAPELPATTLAMGCYSNMFQGCTSLTTAPELPATTLANNCYNYMFFGCTGLTTAPELPATTLAMGCYSNMFQDCTGLTTASELPATTLANNCYLFMFNGCTGLTTAPELPATILATRCYCGMFQGCTGLTTAPTLHATTLADYCYMAMFAYCSSLVNIPNLPAMTLYDSCYHTMFRNCTSIEYPMNTLPATTLVKDCYRGLFSDCTSLNSSPELPALTLVSGCYNNMFTNCSKLNYIKAMFTTTPSTSYTNNWVLNVSSSGTFVKNSAATWTTTGANGVPSGWTVQTASE